MQRVSASVGERKEGIVAATFVSERNEGLKLVFAGERNGVIGMAASARKRHLLPQLYHLHLKLPVFLLKI